MRIGNTVPVAEPLLRLQITAEADPGALTGVLARFQNMNLVPRRVVAESGTHGLLHIQVDVFGVPEEYVSLITRKVSQAANIISAHWHHV